MSSIKTLISTYAPEFQEVLRNNIILAGGVSKLPNLAKTIEAQLLSMGGGKVTCVEDPFFAAADGALKLAQDMPLEYWQELR
jgi:rod shape-determining protein MreB